MQKPGISSIHVADESGVDGDCTLLLEERGDHNHCPNRSVPSRLLLTQHRATMNCCGGALTKTLAILLPVSDSRCRFRCSASISVAPEVSADGSLAERHCRRLILLRHADSSWDDRSLRDHDRPISKTGRNDAASVSRKLQKMGWIPELILSSDAMRTRETLQIMRQQAEGFLKAEIHFIPSFYSVAAMDGQTAEHLQKAICQYSRNEIFTIMCMGHNKGWEEAASMLSGSSVELSTCNAALLESTGASWEEAFCLAGLGGWKLHCIVKPNSAS